MSEPSTPDFDSHARNNTLSRFRENYRELSTGIITVYGNSVEIKEETFSLPDILHKKYVQIETLEASKFTGEFEEKFQAHCLRWGSEFEEHPLWFGGKNFYPQNTPLEETDSEEEPENEPPTREQGDIKGFSKKSRYRMLKKLNKLNPEQMERFYSVTLTYPQRFPSDGETHKADLDVMIKRFKRKFGEDIEYLWKLEFQKRGAPHYHMILHLPKQYEVAYLQSWLSKNWYEVAQRFWDEKQENHLKAGTELQKIKNINTAGYYLSKYINKEVEEEPENQGRYWGCSRNWGVLIHEAELKGRELILFRRLVKKYTKKNNKRMSKMISLPMNLTVFGTWRFFTQALEWIERMQ